MSPDYTAASKFLSFLLRHKPQAIGISLDPEGWASVSELISNSQGQEVQFSAVLIEEIVASSDKQRFEFNEDRTKIRCRQGHSLPIDLALTPIEPPEYLFHGTATRFLESILHQGLLKQKRHHVHLSPDLKTATSVGSRYGKPVILRVLSGKMFHEGHLFYRTGNGVWLTDSVPPIYLSRDGDNQ